MKDPESELDEAIHEFGSMVQRESVGHIAYSTTPLIAVFVVGVTQSVRIGFGAADYWLLVAGPVLAVGGMFAYGLQGILHAQGRPPSVLLWICIWAAFIPYLFGSYLFFVRGVWGIVQQLGHFSFVGLAGALFFGWAGHRSVSGLYRLTEQQRVWDAIRREFDRESPRTTA